MTPTTIETEKRGADSLHRVLAAVEWRALKYPDSKTWSVVGDVSIAKGIKEQTDAELLASAPRLKQRAEEMAKDLEYLTERLKEETGRKHELLALLDDYMNAEASSEQCKAAYDALLECWQRRKAAND